MYMRPVPTATLQGFMERMEDSSTVTACLSNEVTVNLTLGEPIIAFGGTDKRMEVAATETTVDNFADFVGVPTAFLHRIPTSLQQTVLQTLLTEAQAPMKVRHLAGNVIDIADGDRDVIEPKALVASTMKVLPPESNLIDGWVDHRELRMDLVVPEGFDRGIGGDPEVDDITRGGLRIGHNRARGLAPWAQAYFFRLVCTNGMETEVAKAKVEGRGKGVAEMLVGFERMAALAFADIEAIITSFYDMRSQKVDNVERTIVRIGREQKISARVVGQLVEEAAGIDTDVPTMFEVTNHITNMANEPTLASRDGSRRILEAAGGALVTEHAVRCGRCMSRL